MRIVKKNILKNYRKQHGLSRQELAEKLDCSYSLVQLIEGGYRSISHTKAREWEGILNIPREQLCPEVFA